MHFGFILSLQDFETNSITITIRLFSEHQSIPADKTHSVFTERWRHSTPSPILSNQKTASQHSHA